MMIMGGPWITWSWKGGRGVSSNDCSITLRAAGGLYRPPKVIYGPPDTMVFFILVPAQVEARWTINNHIRGGAFLKSLILKNVLNQIKIMIVSILFIGLLSRLVSFILIFVFHLTNPKWEIRKKHSRAISQSEFPFTWANGLGTNEVFHFVLLLLSDYCKSRSDNVLLQQ